MDLLAFYTHDHNGPTCFAPITLTCVTIILQIVYVCICMCVCLCTCIYACMWYICGSEYDCLYVYVYIYIYMHMSTFIIKLMDVLIIYLISTFVHGFAFQTYTPLSTF